VIDEQRLQEIDERAVKATPGPWSKFTEDGSAFICHDELKNPYMGMVADAAQNTFASEQEKLNATFIAHAREDVPALVAEVRRLRAMVETASEAVSELIALLFHSDMKAVFSMAGVHGFNLGSEYAQAAQQAVAKGRAVIAAAKGEAPAPVTVPSAPPEPATDHRPGINGDGFLFCLDCNLGGVPHRMPEVAMGTERERLVGWLVEAATEQAAERDEHGYSAESHVRAMKVTESLARQLAALDEPAPRGDGDAR
jgi:hypothetical protein